MYFSNIANEEVAHFHKFFGADFTLSLTDILSSNLFKVETIIENELFKVCPLFYCNEIISSNINDKIIDSFCMILIKEEHETYISFKTDLENDNIVIDEDYLRTYSVGQSLSTSDYNALIYQLRKRAKLNGIIDFEYNDVYNGVYASYIINAGEQLRNDKGFIINDKIKNEPLTLTLSNPFFINAEYKLRFVVRSLTDVNVLEDSSQNYEVVDEFDVVLKNNVPIEINLSSYENDSVLDFKCEVDISLNVNEVSNSEIDILFTSDKNLVYLGDELSLNVTLESEGNVKGYKCEFYENEVYIGRSVTNNLGEAVFNFIPTEIGNKNYTCKVLGKEENINIAVMKHECNITISSDKLIAYVPTTFVISGNLSNEYGNLPNSVVKIYDNNNLIETLVTDANGNFELSFNANTEKEYNIKAVHEETEYNKYAQSEIIKVVARKIITNVTHTTNKNTVYTFESVSITGSLTDEFENPLSNENVEIYENDGVLIKTVKTNSNGNFSTNFSISTSKQCNMFVKFGGDGTRKSSVSTRKILNVNKAPVSMSINPVKEIYNPNDELEISLSSNYGNFNVSNLVIDGRTYSSNNNQVVYKVLPESDKTIDIQYNGGQSYASINRKLDITFELGSIQLSYSNGVLQMIFKDRNGVNIPNFNLRGLVLIIKGTSSVAEFTGDTFADSNGKYSTPFDLGYQTFYIYAQYSNIVSNEAYYNKSGGGSLYGN